MDETDAEAVAAHRVAMLRREQEKSRWLNSPNAYQKVEVLETGTDHPKVITKVRFLCCLKTFLCLLMTTT